MPQTLHETFRNMEIHDTPHCASGGSSYGWSLEISKANTAGHMITSHLILGSWFFSAIKGREAGLERTGVGYQSRTFSQECSILACGPG